MVRNVVKESQPEVDPDEKYGLVAVELAINNIEATYELGLESIKKHGETLHSKPNRIIRAFAAGMGYRRDTVERARQFARMFTPKDVRQICDECKRQNFPLGVSLICRTMPLGDSKKCMQLLRRAIRERWAHRRLASEIHKRSGAPTRSGRPRALPKNATEASQAIVIRIVPVMRWLEDVKSSLDGKLDGHLLAKINKSVGALNALVDAAS